MTSARQLLLPLLGLLLGAPLADQRAAHPAGEILRSIPTLGLPYGVTIDLQDRVYMSKVQTGEPFRVSFSPELPSLHRVRTISVRGRPRKIAFTSRSDGAAVTTETSVIQIR